MVMETEKGTVEFVKKAFTSLPQTVFVKDAKCRYVFITQTLGMLQPGEDGVIEGKTDIELQRDRAFGEQCYQEDLEILSTGKQVRKLHARESEDGLIYVEITKGPIWSDDGEIIGICGVSNDVTELIRLRTKFEQLSLYDSLTHAYSRYYTAKYDFNAPEHMPCSYIMCDCNNLKEINDRMGHVKGDAYICYAAAVIQKAMEPQSILIRWGGDEFLVITPNCSEEAHRRIIEKIEQGQASMGERYPHGGLAVGGVVRESEKVPEKAVLQMVDSDMYEDKRRKKARRAN